MGGVADDEVAGDVAGAPLRLLFLPVAAGAFRERKRTWRATRPEAAGRAAGLAACLAKLTANRENMAIDGDLTMSTGKRCEIREASRDKRAGV